MIIATLEIKINEMWAGEVVPTEPQTGSQDPSINDYLDMIEKIFDKELIDAEESGKNVEEIRKINNEVKEKIASEFVGYFADENATKATIAEVFGDSGYLIDTHTAVALYAAKKCASDVPVLTASTASPYKFTADVLSALTGKRDMSDDFFRILRELNEKTGAPVPKPLADLESKTRRFTASVGKSKDEMFAEVANFAN